MAVTAVLVALHARTYSLFVPDDAWISLHYARRLLEGEGLTWTGGERVEGYSNLLFVLLCAAGGAAGLELLTAARVIGVLSVTAIAVGVAYSFHPWRRGHTRGAALFSWALVISSGPLAAWAMGGLEPTLLAAFLTWASVLGCRREGEPRPVAAGLLLACAVLTRADAFVLAGLFALGFALCWQGPWRRRLRDAAIGAVAPTVAFLGQLVFRWFYYRDVLPNTAHVKVAVSGYTLLSGLRYLGLAVGTLLPIALAALAAAIVAWRSRQLRFLLLVSLSWFGYVVLIGGDWMPAHRHLVPVLPLVILAAAILFDRLWESADLYQRVAVGLATIVLLYFHWTLQAIAPENIAARQGAMWVWRCSELGTSLGASLAKADPLLAADAAGCWPYFSRFRTIDMLGLADRHIAQHGRRDLVHAVPGHSIGDGRYVLDRNPDLVIFAGLGLERPVYLSGREMAADPRFAERYRPVTVAEGQNQAHIWVRKQGSVGVHDEGRRLVVPALQFAGSGGVAVPHGKDDLLAMGPGPMSVDGVAIGPGRFRVDVDYEGDVPPAVELVAMDGTSQAGAPGLMVNFPTRTEARIAVSASSGANLAIRRVTLQQAD